MPKECHVIEKKDTLQLGHEGLCHQNKNHNKKFLKDKGIDALVDEFFCDGCAYGKQHRSSFHDRVEDATSVCEIVFADVCGPIHIESIGKNKYFLILTFRVIEPFIFCGKNLMCLKN